MINPSTAPTSPNPMPAGLGALTQMSPTPRGKSPSNMGEIMEMARDMSDSQLADVLQGKSLAVPQFAAMTEAMGRKSLRNAVQGMEAQGQAHQPSLKDRLLAEDVAQQMPEASGIGQIPAPNMESMDMASGGIIAFDDGGEVPRFNGTQGSTPQIPSLEGMKPMTRVIPEIPSLDYLSPAEKKSALEKLKGAFDRGLPESSMGRGLGSLGRNVLRPLVSLPGAFVTAGGEYLSNAAANTMSSPMMESNRQALQDNPMLGAMSGDTAFASAIIDAANKGNEKQKAINEANAFESNFPPASSLAAEKEKQKEKQKENKQNPNVNFGGNPRVNPSAANLMQPANGLGGVEDEISKYNEKYSKMFPEVAAPTKRDNPFAALKYEGDSADTTREQGMGYGLMQAGAALLKNPTFAGGLGDAMTAFGAQGWATAKEVKAAKKEEREFNKEIAKANELFAQGEDEKAYKYATLAQTRQKSVSDSVFNTLRAKTDQFTALSTAAYQQGKLDVDRMQASRPDSGIAMLHALQDPKNMATYQQMYSAKNPKLGTISPEFSLNQYNDNVKDNPNFKKQFPTPQSYYNYVQQSNAPQPKFLGFEPY